MGFEEDDWTLVVGHCRQLPTSNMVNSLAVEFKDLKRSTGEDYYGAQLRGMDLF